MHKVNQNGFFGRTLEIGLAALLFAFGCAVGPNYHRPSVTTPPAFKEAPQWKQSEPSDTIVKGAWWRIFGDPLLDSLEISVAVSNQSIAAAEAQYRQARALVKSARAGYFPTLSAQGTYTRLQVSPNAGAAGRLGITPGAITTPPPFSDYLLQGDAAWELDVWGRVRRTVESSRASAQASAADLSALCLSTQVELGQDYFALRIADVQRRLLDSTVAIDRKFLDLTKLRYEHGIASQADVLVAQTQLASAQAQLIDIGVQRSQLEHAVATLIGKPASLFAVAPVDSLPMRMVSIPPGLPSKLLERRPDVAAAERNVAAANAQIGVAKAAFYPNISLSGAGGFESSQLSNWLTWPSRMWSFGGSAMENIFLGGQRIAQVQAARAAYEATVATYRQTVLTAFQDVEDNLAAVRILTEEQAAQEEAVTSAVRSSALTLARYKQGIASALDVITTQTIELDSKRSEVTVRGSRISASLLLIKALGGGWNAD